MSYTGFNHGPAKVWRLRLHRDADPSELGTSRRLPVGGDFFNIFSVINNTRRFDACGAALTRRLAVVFAVGIAAQLVGSVFNIWYNLSHIEPLLTPAQHRRFIDAIQVYNLAAYPLLVAIWAWVVFVLRRWHGDPSRIDQARRRVINLPWWVMGIAAAGWFPCIPVLLLALWAGEGALTGHIIFHLSVSVVIAGVIAMTHGFFSVELLSQRLLFPYFFDRNSPIAMRGAFPLTLTGRGTLWAFSAGVCPIIALLLLLLSPSDVGRGSLWFALAVGLLGIAFSLTSSILLGKLVVEPIAILQNAAQRVGAGDTSVSINLLRADEFGVLAREFNRMVAGLRESERIRRTLGQHVGQAIARKLLENAKDLEGVERIVTVLFADIRGFTTRCETLEPRQAVTLLNRFHAMATIAIEENDGVVNQILGDGLMCLFGVTGDSDHAADSAIAAGRAMFAGLDGLNASLLAEGRTPLEIGVGIHTGPALIGTVGSPRRLVFSAIGDTVNTASRIESLTKTLGAPFLISEATLTAASRQPAGIRRLPGQKIRGRRQEVVLHALDTKPIRNSPRPPPPTSHLAPPVT